jgi:ATP-dependent DNA helicase RecG
MIARLRAAGLPEPEFRQDGGTFVQALARPPAPSATRAAGEVTAEVTAEVTGEVATRSAPEVAPELRLVRALSGEMTRQELQDALGLRHEEHFRKAYLQPALEAGLIEQTVPDKPRSSKQRYRLTAAGAARARAER